MMEQSLPIGRPGNHSVTSKGLICAGKRCKFGDKQAPSNVRQLKQSSLQLSALCPDTRLETAFYRR
jgi:hypothetical protein